MGRMNKAETRIPDMNGIDHAYTCQPFAFDEAFDLGLEIAAVVGGPLGDAFKSLLLGSAMSDEVLDKEVIGHALSGIGDIPGRLIAQGGSRLVARILATTMRIGVDEKGPVKQPLSDAECRSDAYSGGNLVEAASAVKWVLTVNYGPFLTALWEGFQEPLVELMSLRNQPETEETPPSAEKSEDLKPSEVISSNA